ncbi:Linolenate hydroperoxide lyase [Nymphaea thermarum]|nr:Linolenate hydroperoxide lyase [Nymphaea thermarum]
MSSLPLKSIPGSYGLPLIGSFKDRLDYFWFQGQDTFFRSRVAKYQSTVFRTNIPPSFPFIGVDPRIIAITDCKSFEALFDMSLVEKKDILVGNYMPSVRYTGSTRVLAYLDTSEERHAVIKTFVMEALRKASTTWVADLQESLGGMFETLEKEVKEKGKASFIAPVQRCLFRFLCKVLVGADPMAVPEVREDGWTILDKWLALQLLPTVKTGAVPQPLQEILFHSFPFPFFMVSNGYRKIYEFLKKEGRPFIDSAKEEYGLTEEEILHNIIFVIGFNAFGGFTVFLPSLLNAIGTDTSLQAQLRAEVKHTMQTHGGRLSFQAVEDMSLVKSTVYEVLRLNPPVALQFARARRDFELESHECKYGIRKGELLCGYQTLAMRDSRVFTDGEKFVADRFTKENGGEALLKHLFWSNGPQTGSPTINNKQCAAKDYVVATAWLIVAEIFSRYESFGTDGSSTITSLQESRVMVNQY